MTVKPPVNALKDARFHSILIQRLKRLFGKPRKPAPKLAPTPLFGPYLVPKHCTGRLIITGFGQGGFGGVGKTHPRNFYRPFCETLRQNGVETFFVRTQDELAARLMPNTCILNVFNEETTINPIVPLINIPPNYIVFNSLDQAHLIASKRRSHDALSAAGVLMPPVVHTATEPVFSNADVGTGEQVWIVSNGTLDPTRHNTKFIDTTVDFGDQQYFTTVRTLSVSGKIIHSYVRARPNTENASVHGSNTTLDPALLGHLQDTMVVQRQDELDAIVQTLARTLGPGFYACDLLIERGTGSIFLCEVGWKLQDMTYPTRISSIRNDLPFHDLMFTAEYPRRVARAFLQECKTLAAFG